MTIAWILGFLSAALLIVAVVLVRNSAQRAASERVAQRLKSGQVSKKITQKKAHFIQYTLKRANIELSPFLTFTLLLLVGVGLLLVYTYWEGWGVIAALLLLATSAYLFLNWRYERLVRKMVYQMPSLLDHMIRSLKSGRTLGDAVFLAIERAQPPLKDALEETRNSIELGVPLGEAVQEFADIYDQQEFHILAMGIGVNQRYGGNASELLQSLITMIRDREKAQRQLRALTGETRISALVLASLPIGLAVYIFVSNPSFILGLWQDPAGQQLLSVAFAMQVMGCYLLWRMLKSI